MLYQFRHDVTTDCRGNWIQRRLLGIVLVASRVSLSSVVFMIVFKYLLTASPEEVKLGKSAM